MTRPFREAAQRFLIWRAGTNLDWNCTYRDITAATGIERHTVARICKKYGYECVRYPLYARYNEPRVLPVDTFISSNRRLSLT